MLWSLMAVSYIEVQSVKKKKNFVITTTPIIIGEFLYSNLKFDWMEKKVI